MKGTMLPTVTMVALNSIISSPEIKELEMTSVLLLDDGTSLAREFDALQDAPDLIATRVRTGPEAVREIMETDYDVIICNLQMPQMPGEMFYLAVQRSKPYLCSRFIFVTSPSLTRRAESFITSVDGLILFKPARISHLLRMVTLAAARGRVF